ncbi:hypothetical protein FYJ84_10105 [Veillonellaceae bacterium WCA-693-APC-5D-A]|uniref:Uncharacterized protein n=1 Tax=Anaerovibrio slackiae TaxID=2652309 RepID=A0A6I2UF31_9FIRM|nr:hypothetical protein [Anaerovibrio slackiae]MSU09337.1 hypothetical protein [Anaerovibrio slackiae]
MGSRGSFLESGGFSTPAKWHTVDYIEGIKVLAPKDPKASMNLPERSNTPGTSYLLYRKNGDFNQLRVFGEKRVPQFDIDYGIHNGKKSLHVHYYTDGVRGKNPNILRPGDALYEKYKVLFKETKQ